MWAHRSCLLLAALVAPGQCGRILGLEGLEEQSVRGGRSPPLQEVVTLNVGGELFQTQRQTLQASSFCESVFNGSRAWPRDEEGALFLDFEPELFGKLLGHLRELRTNVGGYSAEELPIPPAPPAELKQQWEAMIDFLGLDDELFGGEISLPPGSLELGPGSVVHSNAIYKGSTMTLEEPGRVDALGNATLMGGYKRAFLKAQTGPQGDYKGLFMGVTDRVRTYTPEERRVKGFGFRGWLANATIVFEIDTLTRKLRVAATGSDGVVTKVQGELQREDYPDLQQLRFFAWGKLDERMSTIQLSDATMRDVIQSGLLESSGFKNIESVS